MGRVQIPDDAVGAVGGVCAAPPDPWRTDPAHLQAGRVLGPHAEGIHAETMGPQGGMMRYLVIVSLLLAGCSLNIGWRTTAQPVRPTSVPVLATGKNCMMWIDDTLVTVSIVGLKDDEDPCKHFR